jgi:hypothetical protein
MKPRNLIVLTVIVAAVAAYIYFYERHQLTSDEARERAEKVFPDFDRDSVHSVEINNTHGEFRLAKTGDDWRLVSPVDFPADSTAVSSLLSSLSNLERQRSLSPEEVDPKAYGLDEPGLRVVAESEGGVRFELVVGDETPLGSNRAVQRGGEPEIILCSQYFVSDLDKELDDWRSRDLVNVMADDVASVQVVMPTDRVHVVRDNETWRLLEPIEDLADRDHMRNLITDLNGLRIEEFLDGEVDPVGLGLDEPSFRVTVVRGATTSPVQLDFGQTRDHEGATQVACRRNDNEYFWVNDTASTRLAKAPVTWRATKVYAFDSWDAERLVIESGDQRIELDRAEGLWQLPDGGELDYTAVQDRLTKLANLEAREYDLVEPDTNPLGRVELELKSGQDDEEFERVEVSYTFYDPLEEGGDALVIVDRRGTVMSVDAASVEALLGDPNQLRKPELDEEEQQD